MKYQKGGNRICSNSCFVRHLEIKVFYKQLLPLCNEVSISWIVPVSPEFIHTDGSIQNDPDSSSGQMIRLSTHIYIQRQIIKRTTVLCPRSSQTDDPSPV